MESALADLPPGVVSDIAFAFDEHGIEGLRGVASVLAIARRVFWSHGSKLPPAYAGSENASGA